MKSSLPILVTMVLAAALAVGGCKPKPAPQAPAAEASAAAAPNAQPQVGTNAALQNIVTLQGEKEGQSREAQVGGAVHFMDMIETKAASWLKVDLKNKREFSVGADAKVRVDPFVYDPDASAGEMTLSVAKGVFRYASGGAAPETVSFQTPTASIGIRGTTIEGVVGPEAADFLRQNGQAVDPTADPQGLAAVVLREGAISLRTAGQNASLDKPNYAVAIVGNTLGRPFLVRPKGDSWLRERLPPLDGVVTPPAPPLGPPRAVAVVPQPLPPVVAPPPVAPPPPAPVRVTNPAPEPVKPPPIKPEPVKPEPVKPPPPEPVKPQPAKPPVVAPVRPPIVAGPAGSGYDPFNPTAPVPKAQPTAPRPTITLGVPIGGGGGTRTPTTQTPPRPAGTTTPPTNPNAPKPPTTTAPPPTGTVVYPQSQAPPPTTTYKAPPLTYVPPPTNNNNNVPK